MAEKSEYSSQETSNPETSPEERKLEEVSSSCGVSDDLAQGSWDMLDDDEQGVGCEGEGEALGATGGADPSADFSRTESPVNISGIDRLLHRHKNEIMFELRRLKFGDRPVTGRPESHQAVEALVNRCVVSPTTRLARARFDALSTGRSAGVSEERQRPEEIMIEVNALVERRPVSSILQSLGLRRSLETSLRGVISNIQRDLRTIIPTSTRSDPDTSEHQEASVDQAEAFNTAEASISNTQNDRVVRRRIPDRISEERGPHPAPRAVQESRSSTPQSLPGPVLGSQPAVAGSQRAREWLRDNVSLVNSNSNLERELRQFEFMHDVQRENLIMDISELIQRHLVTSALEGDFRQVLERRMRNRLDESGIDGARVQEQLNQLPRGRPRQRNDFFEMGIGAGAMGEGAGSDHLDDVSVISATAAVALPQAYTQSTAAMGREIHALRNQVKELKSMMQLSFDLQLDIQRAIRQEVAAAVSSSLGAVGGSASGVDETSGPTVAESVRRRARRSAHESDSQCLICLDKSVDTVLYQCGHMCLCYRCGMQLRQQGAHCPVCAAPPYEISSKLSRTKSVFQNLSFIFCFFTRRTVTNSCCSSSYMYV